MQVSGAGESCCSYGVLDSGTVDRGQVQWAQAIDPEPRI